MNQRHFEEKMQVAVIILLTPSVNEAVVVTEIMLLSMVRSFIIFQSGENLTSFNKNNCANFFCEKKKYSKIKNNDHEAFRGVY